ncbi:DUF6250 domain-containing protein [Anaeromyxobacter paludicola]|uniref:Farnesoic acid O-methyl transferase domain-containing protein n=1 Tax=Anaeromyxobacter paludicola TaxID=2918171 RepID=A0ABN6N7J6_9BACT|nr:hypothetical protein [Anaeromyxobacter paludicola]BDG08133.1 hypothetical protein AMPC_12460 [Anaeromyxobacter paludicola]
MMEPSASAGLPPPLPAASPDRRLGWRGWVAVAACVLAANAALLHLALRGPAAATVPGPRYQDRFDRARLGPGWFTTGGHWRIVKGELLSPGPKNNPLWLELRLPRDVAIEFDARSETGTGDRAGDIKFEVFGDGRNHASGYVCIFGGWGNQISAIARLDEHGRDRVERSDRKVQIGRTYHMRLERRGRTLRWLVDGAPFLSFDDAAPLEGPGHDRFGFSGWEADVYFDDLRIAPL